MTDEYTKSKTRVVGEGFDEDNWDNTKDNSENGANSKCPPNAEYPLGDPFVTFGDHAGVPMRWWINYHWSSQSGTYANGWFNSNFDPTKFFELAPQFAITDAVEGSANRIRLTISDTSTIKENDAVLVAGVGGTTEANGRWLAHFPPRGR
jgi:hypothetical protein